MVDRRDGCCHDQKQTQKRGRGRLFMQSTFGYRYLLVESGETPCPPPLSGLPLLLCCLVWSWNLRQGPGRRVSEAGSTVP